MKRKFIMVLLILLLTTACSSSFKNINVNNLKKSLEKKETFALYLTDESEEGNVLMKTLKHVSEENNVKTYYLNTDKLNDKDKKELNNLFKYDDSNIIIFVKDGTEETVLSRVDDVYISKAKLKSELEIQGYIK